MALGAKASRRVATGYRGQSRLRCFAPPPLKKWASRLRAFLWFTSLHGAHDEATHAQGLPKRSSRRWMFPHRLGSFRSLKV